MYLIGTFERWHSDMFEDDTPMNETKIVDEISRDDLMKAKNDDGYQVINLLKYEYYNPKRNTWDKIRRD
jgi:hypothetical protein